MAEVNAKSVSDSKNLNKSMTAFDDNDLNKPYRDERHITISLVHNYSNYRRVNMKVLGQRKEVIGSSIRSTQVLSSNKGELEAYFPALIGLSSNHPDFTSRVKAWLSNIQFAINENDTILNTTFLYNTKKDYLDIKKKEDEINDTYDKVDRGNLSILERALNAKIDALNSLESTKYQYGKPENIEQYLIYRHCLIYKEVAKDIAFINSDPYIRFYIKDEYREAERQKRLVQEKNAAMRNYVELAASDAKFDAVYIAISILRNDNLSEAILKNINEKQAVVMNFVNSDPVKFNKLVADKNIQIKAFIETLILRGELVRTDFNQQIITPDGTFIGANMNEAIAWFENPNNKAARTVFENKIKLS